MKGFSLENVSFSFGDRRVIDNLTCFLEAGRTHGILGPNGSGKTTLLDLLTRRHRPEKGIVAFDGKNLGDYGKRNLARTMALVPQDFQVNFPFTVLQVVMMGRYPAMGRFSGPSSHDCRLVEQAMEQADVVRLSNRLVTELSGGERQRVVFARALAQDAPVLLLDESTSGLDVRHTINLMGVVENSVMRRGGTAIMVMHDINLAARWCHNLLFIKEGRLAAQGPVEKVLSTETIRDVFQVRSRVYAEQALERNQVVFIS